MFVALAICYGMRFTETPVSLTMPATRLPYALEKLGQVVGRRLQAAPALQEEVLLLKVQNVAAPTLLSKVAKLYDARWDKRLDGTWMLQPDLALQRARLRRREEKERHDLEVGLAAIRTALNRQPMSVSRDVLLNWAKRKSDEEAATRRAIESGDYDRASRPARSFEENPAWRAAATLALNFSPSQYLAVPNSSRAVYAERPTPMQRAFGVSDASALARYRTEMTSFVPGVEVQRVRLIVSRWEYGANFNVTLQALDASGNVVDRAGLRVSGEFSPPEPPEEVLGAKSYPLSPTAAELHALVSTEKSEGEAAEDALARWTPFLTDPVKHEPLENVSSEPMLNLANAMSRNLIARPSDLMSLRHSKRRDFEVLEQVYRHLSVGLSTDTDGWLTYVGPPEVSRVSRLTARRLIQGAVKSGGISVDAAAEFAGASQDPFPFTNWLGEWLETLFPSMGRHSILSTLLNEPALRLWDALGPDVRTALRRGESLRISTLPSAAQTRIARWVYDEAEDGEPTERFPNGIREGLLRLTTSEQTIFSSWENGRPGWRNNAPLTAKEFGRFLAKGNPGLDQSSEEYLRRNRFRLGREVTYQLQLDLGPGLPPLEQSLNEVFFPSASAPISALPSAIQAEVMAARLEASRTSSPTAPTTTPVAPR